MRGLSAAGRSVASGAVGAPVHEEGFRSSARGAGMSGILDGVLSGSRRSTVAAAQLIHASASVLVRPGGMASTCVCTVLKFSVSRVAWRQAASWALKCLTRYTSAYWMRASSMAACQRMRFWRAASTSSWRLRSAASPRSVSSCAISASWGLDPNPGHGLCGWCQRSCCCSGRCLVGDRAAVSEAGVTASGVVAVQPAEKAPRRASRSFDQLFRPWSIPRLKAALKYSAIGASATVLPVSSSDDSRARSVRARSSLEDFVEEGHRCAEGLVAARRPYPRVL